MTYNLTDEIKAKLSPEQLFIVEKWQIERAKRSEIYDRLEAYQITFEQAFQEIDSITPNECEHFRSIMGTCAGCDEIENIINPNRGKGEEDDEGE